MKHNIKYETTINDLTYQNLTAEYIPQVIEFYFQVFLKGMYFNWKLFSNHNNCWLFTKLIKINFIQLIVDEPTTVAAGGYSDRPPEIIKQVEEIIDDGVSLIAIDPKTDKIVGIMISHTVERSNVEKRGTYDDFVKVFPPLHAAVMCLFDEIMYPGDLFEKHPDDTKVIFDVQ